MNPPPLIHALESAFAWTWTTTAQATVLIALVLLIRLAFAKILAPRWRYALGLLVLFRLLLPVAPTSSFSIFNLAAHRPPPAPQVEPLPATSPEPTLSVALPATTVQTAALPRTSQFSARLVVPGLWLAGFAAMLGLAVCQQRNFVRKLGRWEPVREPRVLELLEQCRARLGVRRDIVILAATGLNTPALFGIIRPRLLIPSEMLRRLDDRDLRHIFLHELVHLKRSDLLVNWAVILVRAAHWFNPAVWLAFKNLRADQELACDAAVLARLAADERRHYGRTLLNLLDDFSAKSLCPGVVPFITSKQFIKRRITMISDFKPAGRFAALASVALLIALGAFTFTRAAEPADATVEPTDAPIGVTVGKDGALTVAPPGALLVVTVGKDGAIQVGTNAPSVNAEQVRKILQAEAAGNPHLKLILRADTRAAYNDTISVLKAAEELGILTITLDRVSSSELVREQKEKVLQDIQNSKLEFGRTNPPEKQLKDLEDSIRVTEAKMRDLHDRQAGYKFDNPMDPTQLILRLNNTIADTESQRIQHTALFDRLSHLERNELRQTLPTTIPDATLTALMQDELVAEQKLVTQKTGLGENNPDVAATRELIKKLDSQIDDRMKGIMNGLKVQIDAATDTIESLKQEIDDKLKRRSDNDDLDSQIRELQAKLAQLQAWREHLAAQLKNGQPK